MEKYLLKQKKGDLRGVVKIEIFINEYLKPSQNPLNLRNCKKIANATDNRWRWSVGDYRIIGVIVNNEVQILQIIEIDKRDDKTYSHTKG